jgi:hypothetical protein
MRWRAAKYSTYKPATAPTMPIVIHPGTYSVSSDPHQLPAQCLDLLLQLRKLNAQVLTLLCHGSLRRTASWLNVSRSSIIAVVGLGCRVLVRVRLSWCASVVLSVPRDEIRNVDTRHLR